jgi:2,3-bisphosphoglycerate-independent phosphoglycerate mutase
MEQLDLIRSLAERKDSKILLLVMDGLGGLATEPGGKTELETARTPNLDALARESSCGLMELVSPGITPGSGPGHLALFGYDPITYIIQRGALEAAGIDFPQQAGDVATRANFCTLDANGNITDRRAGRIPTEESAPLCALLQREVKLEGVELFIQPVQEHRAVVVFRGKGLGDQVHDTDPQQTGVPPLPPRAASDDPASQRTAQLASKFLARVREVLRGKHPKANMMMLRGFSLRPHLPQFGEVYKLKAAAEATYPMYRGLARLVGMEILTPRATFAECVEEVAANWAKFDFFFLHYKYTDSQGEDGNFTKKVEAVETVDAQVAKLVALKPDVLAVTGDHSTPSKLASHSWHPVPVLVRSPYVRADGVTKFGESACVRGSLGHFAAVHLMPLLLANALRLAKYGA